MAHVALDRVFGIRPPRSLDLEAIAAIAADSRTSEYIPVGTLTTEACRGLLQRWIDDWHRDAMGYWVIEERRTGAVIGWGGVRFVATGDVRLLNMAYRVTWPYWGRGIATWVAQRAHATASAGYPQIPVLARIAPGNVASVRTAEKAGLRRVGCDLQDWPVYADRSLEPAVLSALPAA